jgi:hypothetical protein
MRHAAFEPEQKPPAREPDEREPDEREPDEHEPDEAPGDFGELLPDLELDTGTEEEPADDDGGTGNAALLDPLPDTGEHGDDSSNDLDLGPDSVVEEGEADRAGDALGIDEGRTPSDADGEDTLPSDDEERDGIDDDGSLGGDLDLPDLDADGEAPDDELFRFGALLAAREVELEGAAVPWPLARLSPEREHCGALATDASVVVAGSTDLLWLDTDRATPVRVALDGTRIVDLVLVGEDRGTVLCVTAQGRLLRRARLASEVERLGEVARLPELSGPRTESVTLCQLGPETPHGVLGRASSGLLFRSDDAGATLHLLEPELAVRALSPAAAPLVALARSGLELLLSSDAGRSFERLALAGAAASIAGGEKPGVIAAGSLIGLFDEERGLAVSTDAGRSFREMPGTATVTAAAAGRYEGAAVVFAALYAETRDETRFVLIEAESGRARVIATLAGEADGELGARVERLVWDGSRLFAAGESGFCVLSPEVVPASPH